MPPPGNAGGRFSILVRLFLRQFGSLESVSTGGELKEAVLAVLTLLAAPGYYVATKAVWHSPSTVVRLHERTPPLLWYWSEEWLLLVMSLAATGVLAALQWKSFVLEARDFRILGALPVPRRSVLQAKLASLVIVVLGLHVAVNALAGLLLPVVSPVGYLRMALALQLTLLAQTVFVCASIVALQGLVALVLPSALAQWIASAVQALLLLAVAVLLVSQDMLSALAFQMRDAPHPVNTLLPVAWFMGLYKQMLGAESPQVAANARFALVATCGALAAAIPCCLMGYRDAEGRRPRLTRPLPSLAGAIDDRLAFRHPAQPVAHAVSSFVSKALVRSSTAALIARGWLVLGVAVTLAGFGGALVRGGCTWDAPAALAPAVILPFFGLLGLRASASYPAVREANWVFRVTETAGAGYLSGIRAAAVRDVVLPLLALTAAPHALLWNAGFALAHAALALGVALVTMEWLFFAFPKIPFTCSYLPGRANLRATWPKALTIAILYCGVLPELLAWALHRPAAWLVSLVFLITVWQGLVAWRARRSRRGEPLVFDEKPVPLVTRLDLDG